jgi:hypothetical protein
MEKSGFRKEDTTVFRTMNELDSQWLSEYKPQNGFEGSCTIEMGSGSPIQNNVVRKRYHDLQLGTKTYSGNDRIDQKNIVR